MSEQEQITVEPKSVDRSEGVPGSLLSRMRARTAELEEQLTVVLPVPGYAEFLHVELSTIDWELMRKINERVAGLRDPGITAATKELYAAADQIVAATVKFYEVDGNGNRRETEQTWKSLAQAAHERFPQDGSARQALIALVGNPTPRLISFWQDQWLPWVNGERPSTIQEVAADFGLTR